MSRQTYSSVIAHSNDADFRAWGLQLSNALQAAGLTKTNDTGQINWATVTKHGSNFGIAGYEIYRFNDAHQATCPIFIKIQYGNASTTALPGVTVYIGTGSNGAGTLTGPGGWNGGQVAGYLTGNLVGTAVPTSVFYDATLGVLTVAWALGVTGSASPGGSSTWMVSRFSGPDGVSNDKGFVTAGANGSSSTPAVQHYVRTLNTFNNSNQVPCLPPVPNHFNVSAAIGTAVQTFNWYGWDPAPQHIAGCLTYLEADIAFTTEFVAQHLGAQRTFLACGPPGGNGYSPYSTANHRLALLVG